MGAFNWKGIYESLNSSFQTDKEHPVIGITGNYDKETCMLAEGYYQSVL